MKTISANQNDPHRYDDMLDMPRPISKNHPHMPRIERAAQFKPFAALSGYEDALKQAEESMLEKADSLPENKKSNIVNTEE